VILLQHPNEIEAVFVDETNKFYCGKREEEKNPESGFTRTLFCALR
jgi:hypothetical protein